MLPRLMVEGRVAALNRRREHGPRKELRFWESIFQESCFPEYFRSRRAPGGHRAGLSSNHRAPGGHRAGLSSNHRAPGSHRAGLSSNRRAPGSHRAGLSSNRRAPGSHRAGLSSNRRVPGNHRPGLFLMSDGLGAHPLRISCSILSAITRLLGFFKITYSPKAELPGSINESRAPSAIAKGAVRQNTLRNNISTIDRPSSFRAVSCISWHHLGVRFLLG